MRAIKTHFDGKTIKVPKELRKAPPGEVLVIIQERRPDADESLAWLKAQERAFAKVWKNDEDAVYDSLQAARHRSRPLPVHGPICEQETPGLGLEHARLHGAPERRCGVGHDQPTAARHEAPANK